MSDLQAYFEQFRGDDDGDFLSPRVIRTLYEYLHWHAAGNRYDLEACSEELICILPAERLVRFAGKSFIARRLPRNGGHVRYQLVVW